jgi:hypothetical protein
MHTNMRKVSLEEAWMYDRNRSKETTEQLCNTSILWGTETSRERSVLLRESSIGTETDVQGELV